MIFSKCMVNLVCESIIFCFSFYVCFCSQVLSISQDNIKGTLVISFTCQYIMVRYFILNKTLL